MSKKIERSNRYWQLRFVALMYTGLHRQEITGDCVFDVCLCTVPLHGLSIDGCMNCDVLQHSIYIMKGINYGRFISYQCIPITGWGYVL